MANLNDVTIRRNNMVIVELVKEERVDILDEIRREEGMNVPVVVTLSGNNEEDFFGDVRIIGTDDEETGKTLYNANVVAISPDGSYVSSQAVKIGIKEILNKFKSGKCHTEIYTCFNSSKSVIDDFQYKARPQCGYEPINSHRDNVSCEIKKHVEAILVKTNSFIEGTKSGIIQKSDVAKLDYSIYIFTNHYYQLCQKANKKFVYEFITETCACLKQKFNSTIPNTDINAILDTEYLCEVLLCTERILGSFPTDL